MLFETRDLAVRFRTPDGMVEAVRGVTLNVESGRCLGLVGQSGSGKSQACLGAFGLIAGNGALSGSARFGGIELVGAPAEVLRGLRGRAVSFVFQDPLTALTPHMSIGAQMIETLVAHGGLDKPAALARARELLERCRVPEAARRLRQYPHELSGGLRQRVMIAQAIAFSPRLLIADEPTTALDVSVQAQVLTLLKDLQAELSMALILISHDMGVIAGLADDVAVMAQGRIVEYGPVEGVFAHPAQAETQLLIKARRTRPGASARPPAGGAPLLEAHGVTVRFSVATGLFARRQLRAVDGVDLVLHAGEAVGLVGESGCGKSTLARALLGLAPLHAGTVMWNGRPVTPSALDRALCQQVQIIFQDPLASLDPRYTIGSTIAEPLSVFRPELDRPGRARLVAAMMERVGLDPRWINRYPHEFSGGQNQRVGIARALIAGPRLLVADEAISALDAATQIEVIELLRSICHDSGVAILFITHDLSAVRSLCDRVMVLYLGRVMEQGPVETVLSTPRHPYTRALAAAVPVADPAVQRQRFNVRMLGDLPSPIDSRAVMRFSRQRMIDDPMADQPPLKMRWIGAHGIAEHDGDDALRGG